jgi:Mu transposase-like protein
MTVLDQPAVELIEQLSFLAPRRITDRPVLQLGALRAIRREIGLSRSEQPAVPRMQGMDESACDVGAPGLFLFCAVLAFSRWRFVAFATDQRASTTLALIAEALGAIGGVPARVLADRMGCLKGGVVANVVVPTVEYVRLASHYGFTPDYCHAEDPQSKGIVENLCGYSQRDLAVPLLTEAAIAGTTVDVRAANAAAKTWCLEVNAAVHSEIMAVPDERLLVERELLGPLPSLRLQIGAPSVLRKVDRLSCIRYASARYSVPTRLIGTRVAVVVDHGAVCLVEPATGMIVAEHELGAPGSASILDDHYGGPRPAPGRGRFLPEQTTAVSILDRLLHHATVVITDGQSYRMKDVQHLKENPQPNH